MSRRHRATRRNFHFGSWTPSTGYAPLGLLPGTERADALARVVQEVMAAAGNRREMFALPTGVSTSVPDFNATVGREPPP